MKLFSYDNLIALISNREVKEILSLSNREVKDSYLLTHSIKKKSHPKLPHWSQAVMWKEHVSKEIVQALFLSVFKTQLDIARVTWSDLMDGTAFSPHSFCTRLHWIPHHIPA